MNIYSKSNPPAGFYVYAYIRKSNGLPYYIGKGSNTRAWDNHTRIKNPNDTSKILILEQNLTELGAYALEKRSIKLSGQTNPMYGKKGTQSHRYGKTTIKITCSHCGIICCKHNFVKYHGDKCKFLDAKEQ